MNNRRTTLLAKEIICIYNFYAILNIIYNF